MILRHCCIAALLFGWTGVVHASKPDLFGVELDLPFEYTLRKVEDRRSGGGTISVDQRHFIEVVHPEGGEPQELLVVVTYVALEGVSNSAMQQAFDDEVSKAASNPATRSTASLGIDDFPFQFIDGAVEQGDYPERMSIGGIVNGALVRVSVLAKDASLLVPELAVRLKSVKLGYAELLRAKADFEAEARIAVLENELDSPLSRVQLGRGVQARLVASYLQTDATGQPVFRSRSFGLFKAGFWTLQGLSLNVGCGDVTAFGEDGPEGFLTLESRLRNEDADERPVNISLPQPSTLAGLQARMVTAKGGKINPMRRTDISRWQAEDGGVIYHMEIERMNGSPVEKELIRQLQSAIPMCQLGLQFGDRSDP